MHERQQHGEVPSSRHFRSERPFLLAPTPERVSPNPRLVSGGRRSSVFRRRHAPGQTDVISPLNDATTEITVDRLPEAGSSLEVVLLEDARYGSDSDCGPRRPHRHDYHELVWTRCGTGRHLIDGEVSLVEPNTITLIGRLEAAIELLAAETRRPPDSRSVDLQRHFLSALLLWVERWYEATRIEARDADDRDLQLYRRFGEVLERDYVRHHDAPYYAKHSPCRRPRSRARSST